MLNRLSLRSKPRIPIKSLFPFLSWAGELRDQKVLRSDLIAGITVALVLIPQSMAYAQLAGLPAYYGLYAAFLPPIIAALFGSSRQLATGPVAVVSLMTAAALAPIARTGSEGYIAYAIMLSLMVGIFQLALGLLRLGILVSFLSHPVVIGFTNAAAIIIATSQLDKLFGVRAQQAERHYETVWNTLRAITEYVHWPTVWIAALAFALMIGLRKISPKIPGVLIAVAVTTAVSYGIQYEKLKIIQVDHIASEAVREIVSDRIAVGQEIRAMKEELDSTEKILAEAAKRYGPYAAVTVSTQHMLDELKLKYERRVKTYTVDLDELRSIRFEYVPDADPKAGSIYLKGYTPKEVKTDGNIWRVRDIRNDGSLLLTGGGRIVGTVPKGLPSFKVPGFDFNIILQLLPVAATISLIGFMEAISIAKAMATRTRQRLSPDQELIGQGTANIVGSLFQSYPVSGSFSRSAVNISAGAITGFSSVVTGLIVLVVLTWLTPLLYHLPQATLAAVIMMAVSGLINIKAITHAWRAHRHDGIVAIVSFGLTLAFAPHLDLGIMISAGLALILYLYRTMHPRIAVLSRHPDGTLRDAEVYGLDTCKNISMIRFDGSLYFANTSYFEDKILDRVALKPELKYVIVVGEGINQIDATGEEMLLILVERLRDLKIEMLFTGFKKQVLDVLSHSGFIDKVGFDRLYRTEEKALEYVWDKLGDNHAATCPLNVVRPVAAAR